MFYKSPSNYYNLELPSPWKIDEVENTVTFYDPINGFGAINISSYKIPDDYSFNIREELIEFAEGNKESVVILK